MIIFEHHVKKGKHISIERYNGRFIIKRGGGSWNDNDKSCKCSYCKDWGGNRIHYGLNIPKEWYRSNCWYVLKIWNYTYIRFTILNLSSYVNVFFR